MKKTLLGLSIVVALSPTLASAQPHNVKGGYIGGSLGQTELDVSSEDQTFISNNGGKIDETDTGFKVFGGYRVNNYVAIEGFYADFGEASIEVNGNKATMGSDSLGISVVGVIPVTERFELFGKVGLHAWDVELESNVGVFSNEDGTDTMFGFGAAYTINQVSIRAEYEGYTVENEDISMMSVGIAYKF